MSTQREQIERILTKIECGKTVTEEQAIMVSEYIIALEGLCDATDQDDYFGTEGWRHYIGMED